MWTAVGLLTGSETGPFWNGRDSRTLRCDLFDKSLKKKGTRQIVLQKDKDKALERLYHYNIAVLGLEILG